MSANEKNREQPAHAVIPILMPDFGNNMEEGTILDWKVHEGDSISIGQVLCEVETDKAVMDFESPHAGRLARIVIPANESVLVRQPIAYIAESEQQLEEFLATQASAEPSETATFAIEPATSTPTKLEASLDSPTLVPLDRPTSRRKVSPAARMLAAERGINVNSLAAGSGPGGRILSTDLPTQSPVIPVDAEDDTIGMRSLTVKQTVPQLSLRVTIDADPLMTLYRQQRTATDFSLTDIIMSACEHALLKHPALHSRVDGDSIREFFTVSNLGAYGIDDFTAIIRPPEAAILAVGAVRDQVIVRDGNIQPGRVLTLTLSVDDQVVDSLTAARFLATLQELLENPERIEP